VVHAVSADKENAETVEQERLSLRRALIKGASREPISVPAWLSTAKSDGSVLPLIAALGFRSRFDRPAAPGQFETVSVRHAPERLLGPEARQLLCRLFGSRKKNDLPETALRVLDLLSELDLHIHPFDYPELATLMNIDVAMLDANARRWLLDQQGDEPVLSLDDLDDDNWTSFTPAVRERFLLERRVSTPAEARELCAAALGNDAASVRGKLLATLSVGLSEDDVEYLESFAKDRAASVKKIANGLLARIEGTAAHTERLETAHEYLERKSGGVIGRKKMLMPKVPKGTAKAKRDDWIGETFADVNPAILADKLGMKPKAFADALGNQTLRHAMFHNAVNAREFEFATLIAAEFDHRDAWSLAGAGRFDSLHRDDRSRLWECFAKAVGTTSLMDACRLVDALYETLRVAPPAEFIEALQSGKPWKQWSRAVAKGADLDDQSAPQTIMTFAHSSHRNEWRERFSDMPPGLTTNAFAIADLLDSIEAQANANDD